MSDNFQQVIEYLNERTPQARLERHKAFWGDNPDPTIAVWIQAVERLMIDGAASEKVLLLLNKLDHQRTIAEWNTDPDTVEGEKYRNAQSERGKKGGINRWDKNKHPDDRKALNEILKTLAEKRNKLGERLSPQDADALWNRFYTELDNERLNPSWAADDEDTIMHSDGQVMTRKNFLKRIKYQPN